MEILVEAAVVTNVVVVVVVVIEGDFMGLLVEVVVVLDVKGEAVVTEVEGEVDEV